MFAYLLLIFILVPFVELSILIRVGQIIGVFNTLLIVVVTGIVGASMARQQGVRVLSAIQREVNAGRMPADALFDGVVILVSGILLVTPGIITDFIGFAGLTPAARNAAREWLRSKMKDTIDRGDTITVTSFRVNE
ncbi:MAG: membrane protein FxsA [Candidatus Omnitrophica bacterium]|nr:membrane protein FxsA [Candidatus Omnitrophota bacterium]